MSLQWLPRKWLCAFPLSLSLSACSPARVLFSSPFQVTPHGCSLQSLSSLLLSLVFCPSRNFCLSCACFCFSLACCLPSKLASFLSLGSRARSLCYKILPTSSSRRIIIDRREERKKGSKLQSYYYRCTMKRPLKIVLLSFSHSISLDCCCSCIWS